MHTESAAFTTTTVHLSPSVRRFLSAALIAPLLVLLIGCSGQAPQEPFPKKDSQREGPGEKSPVDESSEESGGGSSGGGANFSPECVAGVYDVYDYDIEKWFDVMYGAAGFQDVNLTILPGSSSYLEMSRDGTFEQKTLMEGTSNSESVELSGTFWAQGIVTGTWSIVDNQIEFVRETAALDGEMTLADFTVTLDDVGADDIVLENPVTLARFECFNTGVLSLWWPTGFDGAEVLFDLLEREY